MNHQTIMTDEKLIEFYLSGDPNAMATLVELYKDRVYRTIYNLVHDKYAAEEIFQDVFICLINNMIAGKTAEEGNFLLWATRISRKLCMDYTRKSNVAGIDVLPVNQPINFMVPVSMPDLHYHENHDKIKGLIDLLPDNQREVMLLNHYGGLSFKEIAEVMKCTLNTALDSMKFGLVNLQKMMNEKEFALS